MQAGRSEVQTTRHGGAERGRHVTGMGSRKRPTGSSNPDMEPLRHMLGIPYPRAEQSAGGLSRAKGVLTTKWRQLVHRLRN